jgi:large subunit ribosomal protein L18
MDPHKKLQKQRQRRKWRVRKRTKSTPERPRLCVIRSLKHIAVQIVDDVEGKTLVSASTQDKEHAGKIKHGGNCAAAVAIGKSIAERATAAGITTVCFDRGPYKYHGRVAALADAAREAGLKF